MISLKEAYRVESVYKEVLTQLRWILGELTSIRETKEIRYKSKAMPDKQDEEVVISAPEYPVEAVIQSAKDVMTMLNGLTASVWEYKRKLPYNIDAVTSINSRRRDLASTFNEMAHIKNSTSKGTGVDFTVNSLGEQIQYTYETDVYRTICYDRAAVRTDSKALYLYADAISREIDEALCAREIDYDIPIDINSSAEQIAYDLIQERVENSK